MVDRQKEWVWRVADGILAKGEGRVTVEAINAVIRGKPARKQGLARGTVTRHLRDWKVAREYQPRLDLRELPEPLQADLTGFAKTLWAAAMTEATARLDDERARVDAERLANDELLAEADAEVDKTGIVAEGLKADVERLEAEKTAADVERTALRAEVERLRKRLDHIRAEEYWDRVMREIHAIIPARGAMTPEEILPRLRQSTHRGARLHREPLSAETLAKKMDVRVSFGKFFVRGEGRTYRRETRHAAASAHGET